MTPDRILTLALLAGLLPASSPAQTKKPPRRQDKEPRPIEVMAIPTYPVMRVETGTLTTDGSMHEWPGAVYSLKLYDPRQVSGSANGQYRGRNDVSARAGLVWDDEELHLFMHVFDDWEFAVPPRRVSGGRQMPPGDSIVLRFDPNRDTRTYGRDPGRVEDREFWIFRTEKGETHIVDWQRLANSQRKTGARAVLSYNRKAKAYTLEASIPWTDILPTGRKPEEGLAIDFQVIYNDHDAPTDPLPQTRIGWTFGCGPVIDPAIYGTLILVGKDWSSNKPPDMPPLPKTTVDRPGTKFWIDLHRELMALEPKPGVAGISGKRGDLLARVDHFVSDYPRLDFEEVLTLMQRRMQRELAGFMENGVLYLLEQIQLEITRNLGREWTDDRPGLVALPGRGFLIRSKTGNVAIDPSFPGSELLHDRLNAVFYPRAQDPLDRHDPLSFRMYYFNKPVLSHVAYHLGGAGVIDEKHVLKPGTKVELAKGLDGTIIGQKTKKGYVTVTVGLWLKWKSGITVAYPSLTTRNEDFPVVDKPIDLMILDPDHPEADALVERLKPKKIVLEGFLDVPRFMPKTFPRDHRLVEDGEPFAKKCIERFSKGGAEVYLLAPGQPLRF